MLKTINILLEKKWFPLSFRFITLAAFLGLVIIGFSSPTNDPFFVQQLSKTNLTTSFVWRLWWPAIILTSIFFGRVWCMVCPVEMITTFFAKIGLKLKRPKWILSGWVVILFYMIVLIGGVTILAIDRNPKYTSYYLLSIVGISILSGLIFEKNTFCRSICPFGYILSIFSKMAIWGWRVKKRAVCDSCHDKSCIASEYTYHLNYKSCGVDLVPAEMDNNNYCLLCAGCLKTCKTYQTGTNPLRPNPGIVKTGFADDLMQINPLSAVEWFFLFLLSGSLIFEIAEFQLMSRLSIPSLSENFSTYLSINEGFGKDLIAAAYLFFVLPAILWIFPYLVILSARIRISFNTYLKTISLIFLPVIIAYYTGLVVMEIGTRFPYYKYIIHDIKGVETIKSILFKQIEEPLLPQWTDWAFFIFLLLALIIGIIISFKVIRKLLLKFRIGKNERILYILPFIFILILFAGVFLYTSF
jgi:polyferredoxin